MRVNENRCRRATSSDFFQHFAVGHLGETASAVFLRCRHAEHADTPQPIDHAAGNVRLPIDFCWIEICIQKLTKLSKRLIQLALLRLRDARIRHHPIRHEMPLEKSFRKSQRLRPCKEQFLSLLNLLLSLRVELVHSIEKRATNSSRPCSHVQSGTSTPLQTQSARTPRFDVAADNPTFVLSYSPDSCHIRCRRRRRLRSEERRVGKECR